MKLLNNFENYLERITALLKVGETVEINIYQEDDEWVDFDREDEQDRCKQFQHEILSKQRSLTKLNNRKCFFSENVNKEIKVDSQSNTV